MSEIQKTTVSRAEYSALITDAIKSMKQAAHEAGGRATIAQVLPDAKDLVATFYERAEEEK